MPPTVDQRLERWVERLRADVAAGDDPLIAAILAAVPSFVIVAAPDGTIVSCQRHGLAIPEAVGRSLFAFTLPGSVEIVRDAMAEAARQRKVVSYEVGGPSIAGAVAHYQSRIAPVVADDNQVIGFVLASTDVSDLVKTDEALRDRELKLRFAAQGTGIGLWTWDAATDRIEWDAQACAIYRVERAPATVEAYLALIHREDLARLRESMRGAIATGVFQPLEHRINAGDGTARWIYCCGQALFDSNGQVSRLSGGVFDVTERYALQEQLLVAQKLEAVGQLTAGIAHNFNNMLMAILPSLELVKDQVGEPWRSIVGEAQNAGKRAAEMVRQLLTFAASGHGTMLGREGTGAAVEPMAKIVERSVAMCRHIFGRHVSIHVRELSDDARIDGHGDRIEQALVNLLLNARDALSEADRERGTIDVEIEVVDDEVHPKTDRPGAPAGPSRRFVRVRVRDEGVGMTESVRLRLFEPFFTTKPPGRGVGLGLATTYAIARQHGGHLRHASEPGRGTTMDLYLPLAQPRAEAASTPITGNRPRVVVVDGEASLRRLVGYILGDAGFHVIPAADGDAALEALGVEPTSVLMILDRALAGDDAQALMAQARRLVPKLRVVVTGATSHEASALGADARLAKPVAPDELLRTVRQLLAEV
jgi:signal transduction histidine kinase